MSTCREVIKSAYRRAGILAAGVNLNASQAEIGMERLRGLYKSLIIGGMFGRVCDYYLDAATYTAKPGQRIYKSVVSTVTIPATVEYSGRTEQPRDRSFIVVVDPADNSQELWLYDRYYGGWVDLNALALDAFAPLTTMNDEHIKNLLGIELLGETDLPIPMVLARSEGRARLALAVNPSDERKTTRQEFM